MFIWSSRLWGIAELFRYEDLSPTGLMVLRMIQKLLRIQLASQPAAYPAG
jgi:hypothetical protein